MKILVITDNLPLYFGFIAIVSAGHYSNCTFEYRFSGINVSFRERFREDPRFQPLTIANSVQKLIETYDMIISLHCKQIFPPELVNRILCINVHPGLNPHNRGWFPQVFSIVNKKPIGATLHLIDEELDHGDIIAQQEVVAEEIDTSLTLYNRVLAAELKLLEEWLPRIIRRDYDAKPMEDEGNINRHCDFRKLCKLDMDKKVTLGEAIDLLRALSHGDYKNGYFLSKRNTRIFVSICLEEECAE